MADDENREAIDKLWKSFVKKRKLDETADDTDAEDESEPYTEEKEM